MAQANMVVIKNHYALDARKNAPNRSTVNCVALDADLAALELTINQLVANLMVIMRDDNSCPNNNTDDYFRSQVIDRIFKFFEMKIEEILEQTLNAVEAQQGTVTQHTADIEALKAAVEVLQQRGIMPQTLTENTTNNYYNGELSHALARASTKACGIVRLNDDPDSDKTDEAATVNALRKLKTQLSQSLAALQKELEIKIGAISTSTGGSSIGALLQRKEYTQAGAFTFTVPEGVKKLRVTLISGSTPNRWTNKDGLRSGIPGKMLYQAFMDVVPGQKVEGKVGAGGVAIGGVAINDNPLIDISSNTTVTATTKTTFGSLFAALGGCTKCVENTLYPYAKVPQGTAAQVGQSGYALIEW